MRTTRVIQRTAIPSIEPLEARIAPAGVVTVGYDQASGALTLTGDGLGNAVTVLPTDRGSHRIVGILGTTLSTGGDFLDIGKLTSVDFFGDAGDDELNLVDLNLSALSFDGGADNDSLNVTNGTVKGDASIISGSGVGAVRFSGLHTTIKGNLIAEADSGMVVELDAQKTMIKGSVLGDAGSGMFALFAGGGGPLVIGKGIDLTTGAGSSTIQLSPFGSTTIGKLPSGESIAFDAGNSIDSIALTGQGNITLAGGIAFTGGSGSKNLQISADRHTVKIGKLPSGHSILETGSGPADLDINALNFTAAGAIELTPGSGANSLRIQAINGKVSIGKTPDTGHSIKFNGTGSDHSLSFDVGGLTLAGGIEFSGTPAQKSAELGVLGGARIGKLKSGESILVDGSAGFDSFQLDVAIATLAGGIAFSGGSGTNILELEAFNGRMNIGKLPTGESILYTGGPNSDSINFTPGRITTAGGIAFTGGDGFNSIQFSQSGGSVAIGKLPSGHSIHFIGGANIDRITSDLNSAVFAGGIEFDAFAGSNDFLLSTLNTIKVGALPTGESVLFNGGDSTDILSFFAASMSFKGLLDIVGNLGSDTVEIGGPATSIGKNRQGQSVIFDGGGGSDQLTVENSITVAGSIDFFGGMDQDTFSFQVDSLLAKGPINFDGGAGIDNFALVAGRLQLTSTLTVDGGDGGDHVSISANGFIAGNVIFDLGGNGVESQSAVVTSRDNRFHGLALRGDFSFSGTGTDLDSLSVRDVVLAREFSAVLGDGPSIVVIDNFSVGGTLTLDTAGGADSVLIERESAFGSSVIAKLATIQTGAGTDALLIGTPLVSTGFPDPTRVRFLGGLTVDGGADTNTRNAIDTENDFPGAPPNGLNTFTLIVP